MKELDSYEYDVFISWTGKDEKIKNIVKEYIIKRGISEERIFDSEYNCSGEFRLECLRAISVSKVFLILLSDNVINDPNVSKNGYFSEVKSELNFALEFESMGNLNFVVLNYSTFLKNPNIKYSYKNLIPFYFTTALAGFSRSDIILDSNNIIDESILLKIFNLINKFLESRNVGNPLPSINPKIVLQKQGMSSKNKFVGRTIELDEIAKAFTDGAKIVVLSGLGGIGKTMIAKKYAEQLGDIICPQIVQLCDVEEENRKDSLCEILDQIIFTEDTCFGWNRLDDQKRYNEIEGALCSLPSQIILIIDNCNSLNNTILEYFVNKLKCRVLFTTRVETNLSNFNGKVNFKKIDKLPLDNAYSLFIDNYNEGNDIENNFILKTEFKRLYDYVDGHTITLTISARIMNLHQKKVDDIINIMEEGFALEEIEFSHNLETKIANIFSHLNSLFKFSNLRESSLNVLRNLTLLRSGSIPLYTLQKYMHFTNRNEINELKKYGWIQLYCVNGEEWISIHNVISSLVNASLDLSSDNTNQIVDFLCNSTQSMIEKTEYSSILSREESLFFALYRLVVHEKKLNKKLWDMFTYINSWRGNPDDTLKKCQKLIINCEEERELIETHNDMMILMKSPNRIDIMERYLKNLNSKSKEYKWVSRQLTVTMASIIKSEDSKYKDFLKKVLNDSIETAMSNEDDLAVYTLQSLNFLVPKQNLRISDLLKYIKKRNKKELTGDLLLLEYLVLDYKIDPSLSLLKEPFSIKNPYFFIIRHPILFIIRHPILFIIRHPILFIIRHPILFITMVKMDKQQEKISNSNDPLAPAFRYLTIVQDTIIYQNAFDLYACLRSIVSIYKRIKEKGLTLATLNPNALFHLFENIKKIYTIDVLTKEIQQMSENISLEYNLESISIYEVSILFYKCLKNEYAISQAEKYVEYINCNNPKGSYMILDAKFELANVYSTFFKRREAAKIYMEIYEVLKKNDLMDTIYMERLCNGALSEVDYTEISNVGFAQTYDNVIKKMIFLNELLNFAISQTLDYSKERLQIISNYLFHMREILVQFEDKKMDTFYKNSIDKYYRICNKIKSQIIVHIKKYCKKYFDIILSDFCFGSFDISSRYVKDTIEQLNEMKKRLGWTYKLKIDWYIKLEKNRVCKTNSYNRVKIYLQALRMTIKNGVFKLGHYSNIREGLMLNTIAYGSDFNFGFLFFDMFYRTKDKFNEIYFLYEDAQLKLDLSQKECNLEIEKIARRLAFTEKFYLTKKERQTRYPEIYFYSALKNIFQELNKSAVRFNEKMFKNTEKYYVFEILKKQKKIIDTMIIEIEEHTNLEVLVKKMIRRAVETICNAHMRQISSKRFEIDDDAIAQNFNGTILPPNSIDVNVLKTLDDEQIIDHICDKAYSFMETNKNAVNEAREKYHLDLPENLFDIYLKDVSLRALNQYWMKHIDDMQGLRQGVVLQSYAQKLNQNINLEVLKYITHINIQIQLPKEEEDPMKGLSTNEVKDESVKKKPVEKKVLIGPNDPCPCGSGKKYKFCHDLRK